MSGTCCGHPASRIYITSLETYVAGAGGVLLEAPGPQLQKRLVLVVVTLQIAFDSIPGRGLVKLESCLAVDARLKALGRSSKNVWYLMRSRCRVLRGWRGVGQGVEQAGQGRPRVHFVPPA